MKRIITLALSAMLIVLTIHTNQAYSQTVQDVCCTPTNYYSGFDNSHPPVPHHGIYTCVTSAVPAMFSCTYSTTGVCSPTGVG